MRQQQQHLGCEGTRDPPQGSGLLPSAALQSPQQSKTRNGLRNGSKLKEQRRLTHCAQIGPGENPIFPPPCDWGFAHTVSPGLLPCHSRCAVTGRRPPEHHQQRLPRLAVGTKTQPTSPVPAQPKVPLGRKQAAGREPLSPHRGASGGECGGVASPVALPGSTTLAIARSRSHPHPIPGPAPPAPPHLPRVRRSRRSAARPRGGRPRPAAPGPAPPAAHWPRRPPLAPHANDEGAAPSPLAAAPAGSSARTRPARCGTIALVTRC